MAIRRRRTYGGSSGSRQGSSVSRGGVRAFQNTIWDYVVPGTPLIPSVVFSFEGYNVGADTNVVSLEDVLGIIGTGNFQTCNFPVYPRAILSGLIVRTNISDFVQYADEPVENIPTSLADTIQVCSDKAQYIGCDNGGANVSQFGLRIKATPKILSISSISQNEVIVSLDITNLPQNIFENLGGQDFYPYNQSVAGQIGSLATPIPIDTYLNRGQIAASGIYVRHLPSALNTSKTTLATNFDFTLG